MLLKFTSLTFSQPILGISPWKTRETMKLSQNFKLILIR